jgi:hypothetical protein
MRPIAFSWENAVLRQDCFAGGVTIDHKAQAVHLQACKAFFYGKTSAQVNLNRFTPSCSLG